MASVSAADIRWKRASPRARLAYSADRRGRPAQRLQAAQRSGEPRQRAPCASRLEIIQPQRSSRCSGDEGRAIRNSQQASTSATRGRPAKS
jgi:hypothetical protein